MRRTLALACCGFLLLSACVIVRHDDGGAGKGKGGVDIYFANNSFDAKKYVADLWESRLIPHVKDKAVDLGLLLVQLADDEDSASRKYGVRQVAEGAPFNFSVKGLATVVSVDLTSRVGIATIAVEGQSTKALANLQVGPIYKNTSIRDGLPFIKFDDFTNQLDYATLSNELNFYVRDTVMAKVDLASLAGKKIEFFGFMTWEGASPVVITPVKINVR